MKVEPASGMIRLVQLLTLCALILACGSTPGSTSAVRGIVEKSPHAIAMSAFGSPLLSGKVTLLSTDARRVLLSVSLVKILPVLVERQPKSQNWFNFEDTTLFKEVGAYLWFMAAFFVLTLMARREVRNAAIPAPRRKPPPGPWDHVLRRGRARGRG